MDFVWLWCLHVGSWFVRNVPLWWGTLIIGEAIHVRGQGIYGQSLYFLLTIAVNLRLPLKNKVRKITTIWSRNNFNYFPLGNYNANRQNINEYGSFQRWQRCLLDLWLVWETKWSESDTVPVLGLDFKNTGCFNFCNLQVNHHVRSLIPPSCKEA